MSLRYFKEKMPKLAVIAAGSLLEFALRSPAFKMPVGRIHFLYLEPLSFSEYLEATGNQNLRQFLSEVKSGKEGKLKSLRMFIDDKKSKLGIRFSQDRLSYYDKILSIPLYMVEQMPRLAGSLTR